MAREKNGPKPEGGVVDQGPDDVTREDKSDTARGMGDYQKRRAAITSRKFESLGSAAQKNREQLIPLKERFEATQREINNAKRKLDYLRTSRIDERYNNPDEDELRGRISARQEALSKTRIGDKVKGVWTHLTVPDEDRHAERLRGAKPTYQEEKEELGGMERTLRSVEERKKQILATESELKRLVGEQNKLADQIEQLQQ